MQIKDFDKVFSALGEPTRLKIIKLLSNQKYCVCELSALLEMLQPRVSQHLRILKEAELVNEQKTGYWNYYELNKTKLLETFANFQQFLETDFNNLVEFAGIRERIKDLACNAQVKATKESLKQHEDQ